MTDADTRARDLEAFANASGQPNQPEPPRGHALVRPSTGLAERVIGAQPVAVHRDEAKIFTKLAALAAAAGSDWFYRFPVRKKDGGQDWIEGPSIKLANDVARIFGNNVNEVREIDVGDAWVFYARFTDIETGFSMERAYRQRKSQTSMRTRDADRSLDIAYQIGQSKAIRNCIVNSLQIFTDYAFEAARDSLVEKIGKDLAAWRERTVQGLAKMPVELARVERVIGRPAKDWLAPNIAAIIAMMKSVADGMASVDEVFPVSESPSTSQQPPVGGEEGGGPTTVETESPPHGQSAETESAAANPIIAAYERGKRDKAKGVAQRALPGEYRGNDVTALAAAWLKGWQGSPL
jgi:hypothetical protein